LAPKIFIFFIASDYADLAGKPFFPGLIKYMASGPVVAMVWEGLDAVKTGRVMLGATNPLASAPGKSFQPHP
jgi:nucleoside-diphosphate kinase